MTTLIRYQTTHKPIIRKTEQQLRQEIIQVCKMLWQKGFVAATDGNVSARLDEEASWEVFLTRFAERGHASVNLVAQVLADGRPAATLSGRFVAKAKEQA